MDSLTFYQDIFNAIITPLMTALNGLTAPVVDNARPIALALAVFWMALEGIDVAVGRKTVKSSLRGWLISIGFFGLLVSNAIYMQWVGNLFLHVMPDSMSAALGVGANPVAGIDKVLNISWLAAQESYTALSWSWGAIPLGIGIVCFVAVSLAATLFTFVVYTISVITVVIAIYIGPVAIAAATLPLLRKYAAGWLSVAVGAVVAQVLSVAVLFLLTGAETVTLSGSAAAYAARGNTIQMWFGLAKLAALLVFCFIIMGRCKDIAHAIAGGVYHQTSGVHAATLGAAAAVGSAAVGVAGNAAGALGAHAGRQVGAGAIRQATPVGRSLSKGTP